MISDIIVYTILGFLGLFAIALTIIGIKDGTFIKETEEQRRQREEKQAAKERRKFARRYEDEIYFKTHNFLGHPYDDDYLNDPDSLYDENLDMFGYPMDED